jgi:ankyrin repeat protein
MVNELIAHHADVNAPDKAGQTPLHLAALANFPPMVELLLKNGAAVNQVDQNSATPLYLTAARSTRPIGSSSLDFLLPNSSVDALKNGVLRSSLDTAKLLIDAGADVNRRNLSGESPLAAARRNKNEQVVELLVRSGAQ